MKYSDFDASRKTIEDCERQCNAIQNFLKERARYPKSWAFVMVHREDGNSLQITPEAVDQLIAFEVHAIAIKLHNAGVEDPEDVVKRLIPSYKE